MPCSTTCIHVEVVRDFSVPWCTSVYTPICPYSPTQSEVGNDPRDNPPFLGIPPLFVWPPTCFWPFGYFVPRFSRKIGAGWPNTNPGVGGGSSTFNYQFCNQTRPISFVQNVLY